MPLTYGPPQTEIEIISNAMRLCGKSGITTIEVNDKFANDAAALLGSLVYAELGSNRWRFAETNQTLANVADITYDFEGWQYTWDLPADMLMLLRLDPMVEYTIHNGSILTKANQPIEAVYLQAVAVTKWSDAFKHYITYALADILSMSVTTSERMVKFIEAGSNKWESRALYSDGQSVPPREMRSRPYINVRYGGRRGR
jgi:hypothetical protein